MIFSKRTIRTTSIPKIRKIHSSVWKLQVKNSRNCQFWPKNGQILGLNGQNLAISEFSRHKEYNFLKEDHKNNFHTKNQEDSQRCLEVKGQKPSKLSILAKFWPSQNYPGIYTIIFSIKTTRVVAIPKIMKIYSGIWKIWAKNTAISAQNGQILTIFGHFWGPKVSCESHGDTTSCKKLEQNIEP